VIRTLVATFPEPGTVLSELREVPATGQAIRAPRSAATGNGTGMP